jgi:hypothetical protein
MAVDWDIHLTVGEVVGDGGGVLRLPRTHEQAKKVRE